MSRVPLVSAAVSARSAHSLGPSYAGHSLIDRAREFLVAGPAESVALIAHVCALPSPPRAVAEHLAEALLGRDAGFQRTSVGAWQLAEFVPARRKAAPASSDPLHALSWVVVDVETTGTRVWRGDRITEVAAVLVRNGAIADVTETLVNPGRPIPMVVSRLTNITADMVATAPRFSDVCGRVLAALDAGVFTAHNAAFDWRFLSQEVAQAGPTRLSSSSRRLCTVRLARAVLPQLPRRSLDALSSYFGVENHARHRAGGDALATARVLIRLLALAGERDCLTWSDLQALLRRAPAKRRRRRSLPHWTPVDPTL